MMNRIDIRDIRRALEYGPWFIEKITDDYILRSHIDNEKEKYKIYANQWCPYCKAPLMVEYGSIVEVPICSTIECAFNYSTLALEEEKGTK